MIYEGSNEIQAIADLLVRKVLPDGGRALSAVLQTMVDELDARRDAAVLQRIAALREMTKALCTAAAHSETLPCEAADDFLRAVALAFFARAWSRIEAAPGGDAERRAVPAAAARLRILPESDMRLDILRAQCRAAQPVPPTLFA